MRLFSGIQTKQKKRDCTTLYTGWVKKVWFAAPGAKLYLFLGNSPELCIFNIFWKFVIFFSQNQKIESQKIRKIVRRKFAIFRYGLIFEEKLFKLSCSFLLSSLSIIYTLFIWNLKNHWKTIPPPYTNAIVRPWLK